MGAEGDTIKEVQHWVGPKDVRRWRLCRNLRNKIERNQENKCQCIFRRELPQMILQRLKQQGGLIVRFLARSDEPGNGNRDVQNACG